jgi:hypothetical protein
MDADLGAVMEPTCSREFQISWSILLTFRIKRIGPLDAFYQCDKRCIDGVKALSSKVGLCRLSRPNEVALPEVRYVSDVVTRWRRHPPEIGITIVLPNMNLFR